MALSIRPVSPKPVSRALPGTIPALRAFITVAGDSAREQAQESRRRFTEGRPLGPLDGIPIGIKDNINVAGLPCTAGTAAFRTRIPEHDARAVTRLKQGGAVLLGKLNMHEGALGATTDNLMYGRCINPLRPGYTPGGSSGGSAAAVAAGFCAAAAWIRHDGIGAGASGLLRRVRLQAEPRCCAK